jgi:hypothetical protein
MWSPTAWKGPCNGHFIGTLHIINHSTLLQLCGAPHNCKTQYASEHGWEHFLLCHKRIVSVLDFWRQLGVTVEVSDEGGYWETRCEKKLQSVLKNYDRLVAALAGACKDAAENAGSGRSVESPVFARKDFERLEAEGWREFARQLG